jgi:hypothetical protein
MKETLRTRLAKLATVVAPTIILAVAFAGYKSP